MSVKNSRIYIGNLPNGYRNEELQDLFIQYGEISEVNIKSNRQGGCFGFISFVNSEGADAAVDRANGMDLEGRSIRVELTHPMPQRGNYRGETVFRLKVEGVPDRTSWQDLKDLFKFIGPVSYANVEGGTGVVEFATRDMAEAAIDKFDGQPLSPEDPSVMKVFMEDTNGIPARRPTRFRGGGGGGHRRGYDDDRRGYGRGASPGRYGGGRYNRDYDRDGRDNMRDVSYDRHDDSRNRRYESDEHRGGAYGRVEERYHDNGPYDRYRGGNRYSPDMGGNDRRQRGYRGDNRMQRGVEEPYRRDRQERRNGDSQYRRGDMNRNIEEY